MYLAGKQHRTEFDIDIIVNHSTPEKMKTYYERDKQDSYINFAIGIAGLLIIIILTWIFKV